MKATKLLLAIAFFCLSNTTYGQSWTAFMDSLRFSQTQGLDYLNFLNNKINEDSLDLAESGNRSEMIRTLGFWVDRLPYSGQDPLKKYLDAQIAINPSPCAPKVGDFNGNWENTGPKTTNQASGIVNDILVEDINNYWVGVHDGGLWKVTNNVWNCVTDNLLPAGVGVTSIAKNPFNPNEMYFGTFVTGYHERNFVNPWVYGHGLWKSTNAGVSWALETSPGVLDDFSKIKHITYCPNLLSNGDVMRVAVEANIVSGTAGGNKLIQKIGNGVWTDFTPPSSVNFNTLLSTTRIVFPNDIPGVFFVATDAHDIFEAYIYRFEYNTTTGAITNHFKVADGSTLHDFNTPSTISSAYRYDMVYAGNGLMYVGAAGQNSNEGCWNLLSFNVNTNTFISNPITAPLLRMPLVANQTRGFMNMALHPNSPNIIYFGGIRPFFVRNQGAGWQSVFINYAPKNVFHDDIRCVKILSSVNTPGNLGSQDVVFWGNDGGVSVTNGNTCANRNGTNFFTQLMYDIDVTQTGKKRAGAAMHNSMFNTTNNPNVWQNQAGGDGFNTIYDKRNPPSNQNLYYHYGEAPWDVFNHNATQAVNTAGTFPTPTTGGWETARPFIFPNAFDGDKMYLANKNMHESQPNGLDPWLDVTDNGILTGGPNVIYDQCRTIALAPSNPDRRYFAFRFFPSDAALVPFYWGNKLFWTRPSDGTWRNITAELPPVNNNDVRITDVVVDDKNEYRIFVSVGGISWGNPGQNRVYWMEYNPVTVSWSWGHMSSGLTELPVVSLAYQHGSDDVIYAGTDAGVYRWDGPLGCWVKFNDGIIPGENMPNVLVHDLEIDYCSGKLVMASYGRGVWETDLYQPNTAPGYTEIIDNNSTVVWGSLTPLGVITNKYIKGSILVKSGSKLVIQGERNIAGNPIEYTTTIYMPKYGRIDVEKGAVLDIIGSRITNDCSTNWYGIFAHGQGSVKQNIINSVDPFHGIVNISKSKIEYAEEALNNGGGLSNPNTGGILHISGVEFYNNRRSAAFYKYENYTTSTSTTNPPTTIFVQMPDQSNINQCSFIVDNNIRTGFFAHVTMWGVRGINMFDNAFINNHDLSVSHQRALYTIDATYSILSGNVLNSVKEMPRIEGFYTGIESTGFSWTQGNLFPITIEDFKFDKNEIGINFNTIIYPTIRNNILNIGMKQTPYPGGGAWSYFSLGSKLVNTSDFQYSWNNHDKMYPTPINTVFQYTAGTEVYNSGTGSVEIQNNDYKSLLIGNDCGGTCGDANNFHGLNYTCNTNQLNVNYDFILQANAIVRPLQSKNGSATGNTFTQNSNTIHWYHTTPGGNAPIKYFYNNVVLEKPLNYLAGNIVLQQAGSGLCPLVKPIITPNNTDYITIDNLNETQINDMKAEFYTNEVDYTNYHTLYQQLIDNGSTSDVIEDIEGNVLSQELQTRLDMLAMSPYLSQEVLQELAMSGTVSNPILFEIIMANPDASQSEEFINLLSFELPTPFPSYMITMIKQSWEGATARTLLENNMNTTYSSMTDLKNKILRGYMLSDTLRNEDTIYTWLSKVNNLRNAYQLIEYQLYKGNFSQSQAMLTDLPTQYRMNATDLIEYNAYTNLYNFKKSLLQDTLEINQLDSARIADLKVIADESDATFPRDMARNALCFFYQICYPDSVRELPVIANNKIQPIKQAEEDKAVTAYPNPAKEYVIFYYNLPTGVVAKTLLVTDVTGKRVYSADLTNKQGQHTWDVRSTNEGNYIYTITNSLGEKYTGKVTIKK